MDVHQRDLLDDGTDARVMASTLQYMAQQQASSTQYYPDAVSQGVINPGEDSYDHIYGQTGQAGMFGSDLLGPNVDALSSQKAVAFMAGPRERICVLGNPVEHCPRCRQGGLGVTNWRPHRHVGELKIRYICERNFEDLDSPHHFDIPLCPQCSQVLYLYEFNAMLGLSNARRLHKYVLKCCNRHVLPLLDLFCQTKKGGDRCNSNFKLQWCYGTMVKRCEAQKNRDHDLWWVRYKNEWKQRRTIIRYKKDFLSHLSDTQRSLLLGLGLEGEAPPDPKSVLGATFDAILSSASGSPSGPRIKKRAAERMSFGDDYDSLLRADLKQSGSGLKRRHRSNELGPYGSSEGGSYSSGVYGSTTSGPMSQYQRMIGNEGGYSSSPYYSQDPRDALESFHHPEVNSPQVDFEQHMAARNLEFPGLVSGTPTGELPVTSDGQSPVAVSVHGAVCHDLSKLFSLAHAHSQRFMEGNLSAPSRSLIESDSNRLIRGPPRQRIVGREEVKHEADCRG